jgi:endonuclease III related protein
MQNRLEPAQRLRRMHDQLEEAYGPQNWWPAETPFEVVLGAYLTQNTSWKAAERSLANLRNSGSLTIDAIRSLAVERLQELIRPSGFYIRKASALKAFVAMLDDEFGSSLDALAVAPAEATRERLLALPCVGFETADAILLYALGHPVPVADEYLRRVVERHHLLASASTNGRRGYQSLIRLTQEAFLADSPSQHALLFGEFHALTVAVGKAHCAKIANCAGCPLAPDLSQLSTHQ